MSRSSKPLFHPLPLSLDCERSGTVDYSPPRKAGRLPSYAVRLLAFRDPSAAAPSDFAMVTESIITLQTIVVSY